LPQIEVNFDIDANGIMHVSAKDKATGKEQKIEIKAGSGLTDAEIQRMVQDAEVHAEEDRKFHELVTTRNSADALVHATRSSFKEVADKLSADDKAKIEAAIGDVEKAIKGDDKEAIESAVTRLGEAGSVIHEQAAAAAQAAQEGAASGSEGKASDDVVDAEFEEVDEKKKP
jgi:molecular chaperone DnaK